MRLPLLLITICAALITSAAAQPTFHKTWDYPPFGANEVALYQAMEGTCNKFQTLPPSRTLNGKKIFGTIGQWQKICQQALAHTPDKLEAFLQQRLTALPANQGKFTGYYKPVLEGSRKRHGPYQTPLVARPKDLAICNGQTGQLKPNGACRNPYPTRAEIESNLQDYQVILWLKDPVDAYFLHIQGSGTVELDDGSVTHVGFAAKNGHPYVAIGKVLKDMGELTGTINADKIRNWLKANPTRNDEVLHANPSFIFFRESAQESPGAFGIQLVAGRSLAVDKSHVPLGLPVIVKTQNTHDNTPWQRIMFAHDVGSAIKGPARGDIYFGHGPLAGERAGDQNAPGTLQILVPTENLNK
ncbi:MAG: murein transglycosylase [Proteobacteria bacterium]|nr:murein transglycosylase [Pseudomonadota bacterium]NBX86276.1 murein transglycosylase [Pseudomonadota bacterium]